MGPPPVVSFDDDGNKNAVALAEEAILIRAN